MFTRESIVLHIPHSSHHICPKYRDLFYLSDSELKKEQLNMADSYVDDLFDLPFPRIVFPVSRLLCDVERFRDDEKEAMSGKGMGVCYTNTSQLKPLKRITDEYVADMLKLYDSHHHMFEEMVQERIDAVGSCLIIDCHSFSSERLPYEDPSEDGRPDICIGMNRRFHRVCTEYFEDAFRERGYSVGDNSPFSGSIVPEKFYELDYRVGSVMIEVNRSLYMDEETGEKLPRYENLKRDIREIILGMPDILNLVLEKRRPVDDFVVISFETVWEAEDALRYLEEKGYPNPYGATANDIMHRFAPRSIVLKKGEIWPSGITALACWATVGFRPISFREFLRDYDRQSNV